MSRIINIMFLTLLSACNYDYQIVGGTETITEYVEVEGETVYVYDTAVQTVYVYDTGIDDPGEVWVDSFRQPASVDGVDILWVIDTSGSMYRYDPELMAGIEAMMTALPESGWRLAMVSNDPTAASTEAQFPLVPGDDIDDAIAMYDNINRGGREEGFDATYEYITNNPYAATWMRSDAALLVVFVSDEEEQSDDYMINVSDFTTWYGGLRGGSTFVSSIINVEEIDSVCERPPNSIDIGDRYMEATNYFSGIIIDICADDWSTGVTDATHNVEPYEEWPLSYIPEEDSINVFKNTLLVDPLEWTYDSIENKVVFLTIPEGQSFIEIGYRTLDVIN